MDRTDNSCTFGEKHVQQNRTSLPKAECELQDEHEQPGQRA